MISSFQNENRRKSLNAITFLLWAIAIGVLASQFAAYPSQVRDIFGAFHPGVCLRYPIVYTVFAPFFQAADALTVLSLDQHIAFLIFLNLLWFAVRVYIRQGPNHIYKNYFLEFFRWVGFNLAFAAIAAVVILLPRPMAALQLENPDLLALDFHSHTSHSWDARKGFTPYQNLKWHRRGGFHAAFITDHNVVSGAEDAVKNIFGQHQLEGIIPLRGEEVSLFQSHWVILGNKELIPNQKYDTGIEGIHNFIDELSKSSGVFVIASLPEYWLYHWGDLNDFIGRGLAGFEIANSAPIALNFPQSKKQFILDASKTHSLVLTGITDSHGWGSTIYVWNTMEIPGWRSIDRQNLEETVIQTLRQRKPEAVQVWTRVKQEPLELRWGLAVDPLLQIWQGARSLPPNHRAITLLWLGVFGWALKALKKRKNRSNL